MAASSQFFSAHTCSGTHPSSSPSTVSLTLEGSRPGNLSSICFMSCACCAWRLLCLAWCTSVLLPGRVGSIVFMASIASFAQLTACCIRSERRSFKTRLSSSLNLGFSSICCSVTRGRSSSLRYAFSRIAEISGEASVGSELDMLPIFRWRGGSLFFVLFPALHVTVLYQSLCSTTIVDGSKPFCEFRARLDEVCSSRRGKARWSRRRVVLLLLVVLIVLVLVLVVVRP
mmetsp:Transcript_14234/g.28347  ORF Transcript_14234/g.28347 Transcript_14234/m.28347 type:complete len:229 (+) Transcript_14234:206-892(+)